MEAARHGRLAALNGILGLSIDLVLERVYFGANFGTQVGHVRPLLMRIINLSAITLVTRQISHGYLYFLFVHAGLRAHLRSLLCLRLLHVVVELHVSARVRSSMVHIACLIADRYAPMPHFW